MHLSPHEQERLGLRLNLPEVTAIISDHVLEDARKVLELLEEVQVEATFPDGTKPVTVHHPIPAGDDAVRLPLPGGWVSKAWGAELHRVAAAAETLASA